LDWFEVLYQEAAAGTAAIPWADSRPNPNLVVWLDRSQLNGDGRRALIVGCGYGDDAVELEKRGFAVTAFDISPTAIAECRKRFPHSAVRYEVADLLQSPPSWQQQFDFVFEAYTLQVLPPDLRANSIAKIADFVVPGGTLLVVTRARDAADPPGQMPWPLVRDELAGFSQSLREAMFEDYLDDEQPPVRRFRAEYRRSEPQPGSQVLSAVPENRVV
jgi:SAM-dependent methyltransferase